jgi:hypothetical protein
MLPPPTALELVRTEVEGEALRPVQEQAPQLRVLGFINPELG